MTSPASARQISSKSVKQLQRYSDLTVSKTAALSNHFGYRLLHTTHGSKVQLAVVVCLYLRPDWVFNALWDGSKVQLAVVACLYLRSDWVFNADDADASQITDDVVLDFPVGLGRYRHVVHSTPLTYTTNTTTSLLSAAHGVSV